MRKKYLKKSLGFTLIEIIVAIGIMASLSSVVIVAINPARQFAKARNVDRIVEVQMILNAINQKTIENKGVFTCSAGVLGPLPMKVKKGPFFISDEYDLAPCLIPDYLQTMPFDSTTGYWNSVSDYNTGYYIAQAGVDSGRIRIYAPGAELGESITVTR